MKTIRFECFKVSSKFSLNEIAAFFGIKQPLSWENYIVLYGKHISTILKHRTPIKRIYIFAHGCITFVNFETDEIRSTLKYLESITGNIDYRLFVKYHESHIIRVLNSNRFKLWKTSQESISFHEGFIDIISIILAKSTALYKLETDMNQLLDESEGLILKLQKGRLRVNSRRFMNNTARILRFEYESINSIRIFERYAGAQHKHRYREVYDELSAYYELQDRFEVLQKKADELRGISKTYSTLSFYGQENRLLLFEIFLLALFPLSHVAHSLINAINSMPIIKFIFK